jgi:carbamoyltransferase
LEIRFPAKSIQACLDFAGISAADIRDIAVSTSDPAKTFSRVFPNTKEKYYLIRRRKLPLTKSNRLIKRLKYKITEFPPNAAADWLSELFIKKELSASGFRNFKLHIFDHHYSHAVSAAFGSGFDNALVVTLDGLGDGLSGTINIFENGKLENVSKISAKNSLGIFFEHVTNLLNMRELEDEGKVMALADFSLPFEPEQNPMIDFFETKDFNIAAKYSSLQMYDELQKILWRTPMEQFAYFAQQALEVHVVSLVKNAMEKTGHKNIALAGGVFSNIKINRKLRLADNCENCFVFPHMGDGGLALGAAMALNYKLNGVSKYDMIKISYGHGFTNDKVKSALDKSGVKFEYLEDIEKRAAELVAGGEIIFWFRDRMEFGPRALGNRSIVARPDSPEIKDRLNLLLKKRVWFQPFCT